MTNDSNKKPFFGMDCMFMQDPKIRRLLRRLSHKGVLAYIALLGRTYYDCRAYASADENFMYIVSEDLNIEEDELRLIVAVCCELGLFDETIYKKYNILTSVRMQHQFCDNQVARRRIKIEIPENIVLDNEYITQSREKLLKKSFCKSGNSQQNAENKTENAENKTENAENKTENAEKNGVAYISKERKGKNNIINSNNTSCFSSCEKRPASGSQEKEKKENYKFSEYVNDKDYIQLLRQAMRSGAAKPSWEVDEYIRRWSANGWRGRYGEIDKQLGFRQWKIQDQRKIKTADNKRVWMSAQYREQIDNWLRLVVAVGADKDIIDSWRGLEFERDTEKLIIKFADAGVVERFDDLVCECSGIVKEMFGNEIQIEYKI